MTCACMTRREVLPSSVPPRIHETTAQRLFVCRWYLYPTSESAHTSGLVRVALRARRMRHARVRGTTRGYEAHRTQYTKESWSGVFHLTSSPECPSQSGKPPVLSIEKRSSLAHTPASSSWIRASLSVRREVNLRMPPLCTCRSTSTDCSMQRRIS